MKAVADMRALVDPYRDDIPNSSHITSELEKIIGSVGVIKSIVRPQEDAEESLKKEAISDDKYDEVYIALSDYFDSHPESRQQWAVFGDIELDKLIDQGLSVEYIIDTILGSSKERVLQ